MPPSARKTVEPRTEDHHLRGRARPHGVIDRHGAHHHHHRSLLERHVPDARPHTVRHCTGTEPFHSTAGLVGQKGHRGRIGELADARHAVSDGSTHAHHHRRLAVLTYLHPGPQIYTLSLHDALPI